MRVTDEAHFHTSEQVEGYVQEARRLADAAGLSDEDRRVLLPVMVELLSAKQAMFEQTAGLMAGALPDFRQPH